MREWVSCFPVYFAVMSTYLRTSDGSTTTVVKVAQSTSRRFPISFGCHIYIVVSRRRHVHIQAHSKVVEQEKKERRVGINWQSTLIQLWFVALGKVIFYYLLFFLNATRNSLIYNIYKMILVHLLCFQSLFSLLDRTFVSSWLLLFAHHAKRSFNSERTS